MTGRLRAVLRRIRAPRWLVLYSWDHLWLYRLRDKWGDWLDWKRG